MKENVSGTHKILRIVGIRGIPAKHGGFETFAQYLSTYLQKRGWKVIVYCQEEGEGRRYNDVWHGVHRVHISIYNKGAIGTVLFDLLSIKHALSDKSLVLTLGYNTAVFNLAFRIFGITNLINMDGIEWKRQKWTTLQKSWLYVNERVACWVGNHLIADHPEIEKHLSTRASRKKISMIPYGADEVTCNDPSTVVQYGVEPKRYCIVIARPEPENSILEIVRGFSNKKRDIKLIVLGNYEPESVSYHKSVLEAASSEVIFPGAIYEKQTVNALRYYARIYVHGHSVGGTNPSLVEAMGASLPILANENKYNRWVLGEAGKYFENEKDLSALFDSLVANDECLKEMSKLSKKQHSSRFTWDKILSQYETLLESWK